MHKRMYMYMFMHMHMNVIYFYTHSFISIQPWRPGLAGTRAQSCNRYGSGTLHPGQVHWGSLPLLSPYTHIYIYFFLFIFWHIHIHFTFSFEATYWIFSHTAVIILGLLSAMMLFINAEYLEVLIVVCCPLVEECSYKISWKSFK